MENIIHYNSKRLDQFREQEKKKKAKMFWDRG